MGTTVSLIYTGDPCQDCDTETRFYGSCSKYLSDACAAKKATSPYATPPVTTGGAGSVPAPPSIPGAAPARSCSSCRPSSGAATVTPTGGVVAAPTAPKGRGYPWWVIVLALLVLAGVTQRE